MKQKSAIPVEWTVEDSPVPYTAAETFMRERASQIARGSAPELVWLLEHPPVYTAGTSAREDDLRSPERFPVFTTGRGGQYTYHGPGQRIAYVMLNLKQRQPDVRAFVSSLEDWVIDTLFAFGIKGQKRTGRIGIWVEQRDGPKVIEENKIAALGIRLHKWVSYHGISINIDPDLEHFSGIVPCGIDDHGITSFEALGLTTTMDEVDQELKKQFENRFGPTTSVQTPIISQETY